MISFKLPNCEAAQLVCSDSRPAVYLAVCTRRTLKVLGLQAHRATSSPFLRVPNLAKWCN